MTELQLNRCAYWDCGWCYAPAATQTNANNGTCWAPYSCPQQQSALAGKANAWPDEDRINKIGQNGNEGHHYMKIKLLHEGAKAPARATEHAAGYDIFCNEHITLIPGARALISTGFAMAIPHGMVALIWPRSGLAGKHGIDSLAGVVDSDYRGEVRVALINHGCATVEFKPGDRIAQMLVQQVYQEPVVLVDDLDDTARGAGGFGSTGY